MKDFSIRPLLAGLGPEDPSLAAFAQLALLRLEAEECHISLWDADREHLLVLVSQHALHSGSSAQKTQQDRNRTFYSCPKASGPSVSVLKQCSEQLSANPKASPPIVISGHESTFTCAIPMVHTSGDLLGCIVLTKKETHFVHDSNLDHILHETANATLRYLLLVEENTWLTQNSNLIRGLDIFYSGGQDLDGTSPADRYSRSKGEKLLILGLSNDTSATDLVQHADSPVRPRMMAINSPRQSQYSILQSASHIASEGCLTSNESHGTNNAKSDDLQNQTAPEKNAARVVLTDKHPATEDAAQSGFDRACGLLLQVVQLEGCVFLKYECASSSEEYEQEIDDVESRPAKILNFQTRRSMKQSESIANESPSLSLQQLRSLTQAFPFGEMFVREKLSAEQNNAEEVAVHNCVPEDAVSILFVPLSLNHQEPPVAACLAWTTASESIIDPQVHLPLLRVLGQSALAEHERSRADAADAIKSRFIESITHELRSPLHGILGGIEFIRATKLQVFEKHMLDTVESCGNTLLDLIENVLEMSSLNDDKRVGKDEHQNHARDVQLDTRPGQTQAGRHDMVRLIEEVMMSALLAHITLTRAKSQQEEGDKTSRAILRRSASSKLLQPRLPQVVIQVDWKKDWICSVSPGALRRIILSLFSNALKFTTSGHILITAESAQAVDATSSTRVPKDAEIALSIIDTGRGVDQDFLSQQAGSPFQQEDILTPGAGLGLHLVKKTVRRAGGIFEMSSVVGEGTKATVYLPTSRYIDPSESSDELSARSIRNAVQGLPMALLGWDISDSSREYEGLQLAKQSFKDLFEVCFGMHVELHRTLAEKDDPAIILCDDMTFEKLRSEGSLDNLWQKPKAFLVFCSSIRYAAYMSSEYPGISFLTPPPGPNQLSRVLARYFTKEVMEGRIANPDGQTNRMKAVDSFVQKVTSNEERFDAMTAKAETNVRSDNDEETAKDESQNSAEPRPVAQEEHKSEPPGPVSEATPRVRLLLVEDNCINMQLLTRFAKKHNIVHETAADGQQALDAYERGAKNTSQFNVIIMDISMPVMDGLESTRRIRAFEEAQKLPASKIVALTGAVSDPAREDAFAAGCDIFLTKPASFQKLKALLDDIV